jgi:dihydrofolate reductase
MIAIIAAVAQNGVIGVANQMPWRIPEDLKRFKALTMGHTLVMGRKTFDSIGRPLPGRKTIVITRDRAWAREGVTVAGTIDEALAMAEGEVYVAGGGEIYAQTLSRADRLYLTHVEQAYEGDARFPEIGAEWRAVKRERHEGFEFVDYERS